MEWYYGNGGDEHELVTREQHVSSNVPLTDRWTQWGICSNASFDSPNKYFVAGTKSSGEIHCSHNKFSDEVEMDLFSHDSDQASGLTNVSAQTQQNASGLSSMFTDDQSYVQNEEACQNDGSFRPEWNTTKAVELSERSTIETLGGETEMWDFSLSPEQDNKHFTISHHPLVPEEKVSASARAHAENVSAPTENDNITECGNDNMSVEESLLLDFELVMNQMSEQTRYCFRDALYRLARNSESPDCKQNECDTDDNDNSIPWDCTATTTDESSRYNKSREESEAKTNSIDRTVASLMFSNMNFSLEGHQQQT